MKFEDSFNHEPAVGTLLNLGRCRTLTLNRRGSVGSGDRLRITAQLIEASSDTHLWSETYDETVSDWFDIEDRISTAIATELQLTLLGEGAVGVIAALMNILDSFITFLFYLSVIFVPVAGVIIVDYLLIRTASYSVATLDKNRALNLKGFVAWTAGAAG